MQLEIINIQVSDGLEIIPTVTMEVNTPKGVKTKTAIAQPEESINHAILRVLILFFPKKLQGKQVVILSCGYNLRIDKFRAHAHIVVGSNGNRHEYKRKGNHKNPHMAIACAFLNCLSDA